MTRAFTAAASSSKTVVVLGASYGGARAARLLALSLPQGWRLVVIDRNSHMNHVYVFPRFSILPIHAPKAFIPYTHLLDPPPPSAPTTTAKPRADSCSSRLRPKIKRRPTNPSPILSTPPLTPSSSVESLLLEDKSIVVQGSVTRLNAHSVTFTRPVTSTSSHSRGSSIANPTPPATPGLAGNSNREIGPISEFDGPEETVSFDYCVYALGCGMPDPVNVWSEHPNLPPGIDNDERLVGIGSKKCGINWMKRRAEDRRKAKRVLIVGGGALGIQFATDLKEIYPDKHITLLHSRTRLMPLYPESVHTAVMDALHKLGVEVVLGERVMTWPEDPEHLNGKVKVVRTNRGREFHADLVLPCTGPKPHSSYLANLAPSCISPSSSRIRVYPTMQVQTSSAKTSSSRQSTLSTINHLSKMTLSPKAEAKANGHPYPTPPNSQASSEVAESETDSQAHDDQSQPSPDLKHIFAIGDCAESGAIQAGHTAHWQAEVAARNILRLIDRQEGRARGEELEAYKPGVPAIKISLGLKNAVNATGDDVKLTQDGVEDLRAMLMWPLYQAENLDVNA